MSETIALIGISGSGKSEIGRLLASMTGREFRDTDQLVAARVGSTISEIFEREGEDAFRQLESQALNDALASSGSVVACGGGIVVVDENIAMLREFATVIYLRCDVKTASERVGEGADRPMLSGRDREEVLREMARERGPLYEAVSDLIVDAEGPAGQVASRIVSLLGGRQ